jgi:nucleoside-diphosphate-sugar epimerase
MVLVTGGTGFLGAYIIKALVERGHSVRAIRRNVNTPFFIPSSVFDSVEWVSGDVLDIMALNEAMQGVESVIHAAAKVSFHKKDRRWMYQTNVEGTANVVNLAMDNNISRLVHVSSVAAIGRKGDGAIVTELKTWEQSKLNTHYALSKHHAEMEVWRGIGEGLNAVILNPSTILGFGDWNSSSCAIFRNVYNEFPWYTTGVNGFVDVEDVAVAAVLLFESSISGQRFIVNGDNWSFHQLLNTIADGFGRKRPSKEATPFLASIAWRLDQLKSWLLNTNALLTRESAKIAQSKTYFDNSKILQALPGFSFTPLEQSIQQACSKYLRNVNA